MTKICSFEKLETLDIVKKNVLLELCRENQYPFIYRKSLKNTGSDT